MSQRQPNGDFYKPCRTQSNRMPREIRVVCRGTSNSDIPFITRTQSRQYIVIFQRQDEGGCNDVTAAIAVSSGVVIVMKQYSESVRAWIYKTFCLHTPTEVPSVMPSSIQRGSPDSSSKSGLAGQNSKKHEVAGLPIDIEVRRLRLVCMTLHVSREVDARKVSQAVFQSQNRQFFGDVQPRGFGTGEQGINPFETRPFHLRSRRPTTSRLEREQKMEL